MVRSPIGPGRLPVEVLRSRSCSVSSPPRFAAIDVLRGVTILWVTLPGLWMLTVSTLHLPVLARWLSWAGTRSLSLLVAQDFLRLTVGTALVLGVRLGGFRWWLAVPVYLTAALALARWWERLQAIVAASVWPEATPASRVRVVAPAPSDAGAPMLR